VYRYSVILFRDVDNGQYTATVPALPPCYAAAPTADRALSNAYAAVRAYLEELAGAGAPIPEESEPPRLVTVEI
jgi:predicted RNase H-like HicB family nuclease